MRTMVVIGLCGWLISTGAAVAKTVEDTYNYTVGSHGTSTAYGLKRATRTAVAKKEVKRVSVE